MHFPDEWGPGGGDSGPTETKLVPLLMQSNEGRGAPHQDAAGEELPERKAEPRAARAEQDFLGAAVGREVSDVS